MEDVYEAFVARLAMLGYTVTDDDKTGLEYTIHTLFSLGAKLTGSKHDMEIQLENYPDLID